MFGNNGSNNTKDVSNSKNTKSTTGPVATGGLNSISQGTTVEGSIKASSDIRVDGTIKGKLFCDAKVIIGPTGYIDGEVRCENAVVEGKFEGQLHVKEMLNVRETANITGEVTTGKLIVQTGGVFNVSCAMGKDGNTFISSTNKLQENGATKTAKAV